MWADNETSEDLLGFKVHADLLIDVINDERILPVTIGVFGDWGSGKSSILKIVHQELTGEGEELKDDTLVLFFNGWVFEGYDDAKAALLESIIEKFENHKTIGNKIKDETKKLLKSVKWMRALGFGFKKIVVPSATAYFTGGLSLIPHLVNEFSKLDPKDLVNTLTGDGASDFLQETIKNGDGNGEETTLVREFRDDFKRMIEKSGVKKLVVIIDDLDRCTPERIIENLEAIKLFLNVDRTAFIIGADPRIVRHAIEHRYKTDSIEKAEDPDSRNDRIVNDYLEKLIQIPYNLPKLSDNEVETYMTLLFCKKELPNNFDSVLDAFCSHREHNRYGVFGFGSIGALINEEDRKNFGDSVSLIASLSPIITEGLNGNPRQIKRFLNTFTLRRRLVEVAKIPDFKVDILAKLMVLEYSELTLFKQLYEWQVSQNGLPTQIQQIEDIIKDKNSGDVKEELEGKGFNKWSKDRVIKWLTIDPKLSEVDLRDYFWISRDKLSASIPGSSLIAPIIKLIFQKLDQENLPGQATKHIIANEVKLLGETELNQFLEYTSLMLRKYPDKNRIYSIFHYLIEEQILGAETIYQETLRGLGSKLVPAAVGNSLKRVDASDEFKEFLKKLFNDGKSPASKAFNLK